MHYEYISENVHVCTFLLFRKQYAAEITNILQ